MTVLAILFATESGGAEGLARLAATRAAERGIETRVASMGDVSPVDLLAHERILMIAATAGEGEPPEAAEAFFSALCADGAPRLDGMEFAVLALGDQAYPRFCGFGNSLDPRLAELGGTRLLDLVECDFDFDVPARAWIEQVLEVIDGAGGTPAPAAPIAGHIGTPSTLHPVPRLPFEARILRVTPLSGSPSAPTAVQVTLSLEGSGIAYQPGDVLTVMPDNDPQVVAELVDAACCTPDDASYEQLLRRREVTTLTAPVVRRYAELTGHPLVRALADDPDRLQAYLDRRWVVDLLRDHPVALTTEELVSLLRPLPPRSYSVASSPRASEGTVDLVIARVAWEHLGAHERAGVAGGDLTRRRPEGGLVAVTHRPNTSFHLPRDPDLPLIMIGPGTGVAPFRGFLQDRDAAGARGRNWLVFGHRRSTADHWYRQEWEDLLSRGVLDRLDLAFSRDQASRVYVQHRLREAAADLLEWVADGACLYVCGSRPMAVDVETVLDELLVHGGAEPLAGLQASGRYRKDVY